MEKLLEVVKMLRQRIDEHESELSQSEAQTRYSLVDPLLRALGWDVEDPRQVTVEYPVDVGKKRDGRADYTLFVDEKREVVIEAKRLNTLQSESMFENKPQDDIVAKGIRYCAKDGIPYLLVEPVKWLAENGKLHHDRLPVVMTPNGRPSLVAKEPKHRNNKPWGEKYTQYLEDANVYVYTKCGKDRTFKYAKHIIERMRFNPENFAVSYDKS